MILLYNKLTTCHVEAAHAHERSAVGSIHVVAAYTIIRVPKERQKQATEFNIQLLSTIVGTLWSYF